MRKYRCEIDAEYFPSSDSSLSVRTDLNHEDVELLAALQELAVLSVDDITHHMFKTGSRWF